MANNTGIENQTFNIFFVHCRDANRVKLVKGAAVVFTLFQYGDPRQSGLLALKTNHLKQLAGILFSDAPLVIVVLNV